MTVQGHWRYRFERGLFRLLAWLVLGSRGRMDVRGIENVPARGPVILVANHVATMDPPLAGFLVERTDVHYMAKAESFGTRWARFFITGANGFPVNRHSVDRAAVTFALRVLAAGRILVMFPEGTRSHDHRLGRAYPGIGLLARRSAAPVVCVAIWGTEHVLPKGRLWPHSAPVHVRFGEPFVVPARDAEGHRVGNQEAADMVMRRLAALLPPEYRGVYADPDRPATESPAA